MGIVVTIDKKGRIVLPKKIRESVEIRTPGKVLISSKGKKIEIVPIDTRLLRAKRIASRKLRDWKEEEHRGEKLLMGMKG